MAVEAGREKLEPQTRGCGRGVPLSAAASLADAELLRRVRLLAGREREATVELVAHLAELDARRLYLGEGYSSLFGYCTGALHLAEHAAYNRIEAARASRDFPALLGLLADGSLNLATVRLLAPHLRPDNFAALVKMAKGKSKRDVEVLVARLAPCPAVASSVRKLPTPRPMSAPSAAAAATGVLRAAAPAEGGEVEAGTAGAVSAPNPVVDACRAHRPAVTPLATDRYRVQFTLGEATHEKLRRAQDLLRREVPDGDPGVIFDRALTLLLEDIARKRLAATSKPKPRPVGTAVRRSRHVPAHVKRAVWLRDEGRCAFVAPNGRRCTERAFLDFHHPEPYAIGGETTVANISLRCHRHNLYEAELAFGPTVVFAAGEARCRHSGARVPGGSRLRPESQPEGRARNPAANSPRGESGSSDAGATRSRAEDLQRPQTAHG